MATLRISRPGWDDTTLEMDDEKLIAIEQGADRVVLDRSMWYMFSRMLVLKPWFDCEEMFMDMSTELLGVKDVTK